MLGLKRCQFDIRFIYLKQNTQTHTQTLHVKKRRIKHTPHESHTQHQQQQQNIKNTKNNY